MDADPLHDFTDRGLRKLLAKPDNLRDFLANAIPDEAPRLDVDRMKPAATEFLVGNFRRRVPDLLFEIPYRTADSEVELLVCLLLEHQSKAEWQVPLRTIVYAALDWEWQLREWERLEGTKPPFRLRPVLPIVLYTGERKWGTAESLRDLLDPVAPFRTHVPDWRPILWQLNDRSADELIQSEAAFLQSLAILKADNQDLAEAKNLFAAIFRRLDPIYARNHERWFDLVQFQMGWAHHRRPIAERAEWHDLAIQVQADAQRKREVEMASITIAQGLRQEGRLEGLVEGEITRARKYLVRQGRKSLREPDAITLAALEGVTDLNRLDRMFEAIDTCKSWADVLLIQ